MCCHLYHYCVRINVFIYLSDVIADMCLISIHEWCATRVKNFTVSSCYTRSTCGTLTTSFLQRLL